MGKGLETKAKIIEAALELFYQKGFHKVSLPEIGKAVGISHAAIYEYFEDKDHLLAECTFASVHAARARIDETIGPNDPAEKKLKAYILANIHTGYNNPSAANQLLSLYFYAMYNPRIREVQHQINVASTARIEGHLIQGNREGAWSVNDPAARARMVHDLLLGEVFKLHLHKEDMEMKKRAELVWRNVRRLLS